ncbi:MAG: HEAT repeat domain-containing protein [Methylacidiphilales bacterium]|nr:HEAT repeat domain-containing protein [Candidatus Methylacidiphilales bacterium]
MKSCLRRVALVACAAMILASCGNKETKEALTKAKDLEGQKRYEDANQILVDALRARETEIRADFTSPKDQAEADTQAQKVQSDSEILKLEREQIPIYLHLERPDLASAVYNDILTGHPGDTVVYDTLRDPDPDIRTGAVRILGLAAKPESIDTLIGATHDSDKDVRRAAVAALGSIKDPRSVPPLIDALKDSYWFVRSDAAEALGREQDLRALKPLLANVSDSDNSAETSAENALLLLCGVPGISADEFASRLNDPNPKVVVISTVCLALLHDPRAVPELEKLAASPDTDTRLHAVKALGETGDSSVIPTLQKTLKDTDANVRGWSIIGLAKLKDQGSVTALQAIAADANELPTVRSAASAAVAHITGNETDPNAAAPVTPSGP